MKRELTLRWRQRCRKSRKQRFEDPLFHPVCANESYEESPDGQELGKVHEGIDMALTRKGHHYCVSRAWDRGHHCRTEPGQSTTNGRTLQIKVNSRSLAASHNDEIKLFQPFNFFSTFQLLTLVPKFTIKKSNLSTFDSGTQIYDKKIKPYLEFFRQRSTDALNDVNLVPSHG
ncbi:hypothetical protein SUGI_1064280 [Cryptomeria japonica]|nr:hypothetical protein SUGI_1064280 [Cryptomeria japonica]